LFPVSILKADGSAVIQGQKTALFRESYEAHQYTPWEKLRYMVNIYTTEI